MAVDTDTYGSVSGVEALCYQHTDAGSFSSSTTPTLTQVEGFLDDGAEVMDARFANEGLSTPITDTDVLELLAPINEMYAAARVEDLHTTSRGAAGEYGTKGGMWQSYFDREMEILCQNGGRSLIELGASVAVDGTAGIFWGGSSKSEEKTARDADDFVYPTFQRGMMENA